MGPTSGSTEAFPRWEVSEKCDRDGVPPTGASTGRSIGILPFPPPSYTIREFPRHGANHR